MVRYSVGPKEAIEILTKNSAQYVRDSSSVLAGENCSQYDGENRGKFTKNELYRASLNLKNMFVK